MIILKIKLVRFKKNRKFISYSYILRDETKR